MYLGYTLSFYNLQSAQFRFGAFILMISCMMRKGKELWRLRFDLSFC